MIREQNLVSKIEEIDEHGEINSNKYSNNHNNKGDTTNVTKAVARKSILMQITRPKAANGFH
jgi:hypothetical protein